MDISFGYPDFHHNEKLESFNPGFVTGFMMVKKWGLLRRLIGFGLPIRLISLTLPGVSLCAVGGVMVLAFQVGDLT